MANLVVLAVGKIKNASLANLQQDYLSRLLHYTRCELVEVADATDVRGALLKKLKEQDYIVVLDETGRQFTSQLFSRHLQTLYNQSTKRLVFIVGGAYGLDAEIKNRAQLVLSLATLTLPHELARVLLLEQLYRAHTILKGEKYHH